MMCSTCFWVGENWGAAYAPHQNTGPSLKEDTPGTSHRQSFCSEDYFFIDRHPCKLPSSIAPGPPPPPLRVVLGAAMSQPLRWDKAAVVMRLWVVRMCLCVRLMADSLPPLSALCQLGASRSMIQGLQGCGQTHT